MLVWRAAATPDFLKQTVANTAQVVNCRQFKLAISDTQHMTRINCGCSRSPGRVERREDLRLPQGRRASFAGHARHSGLATGVERAIVVRAIGQMSSPGSDGDGAEYVGATSVPTLDLVFRATLALIVSGFLFDLSVHTSRARHSLTD